MAVYGVDLRTELARRAKKALFNSKAMATERQAVTPVEGRTVSESRRHEHDA